MMSKLDIVQKALKQVYDPEFPLIDIFTMGLIYDIQIDENNLTVKLLITYTTPACPMGELIQDLIIQQVESDLPGFRCEIQVTFEPMRNPEMIKDEDIRQMFE